jgi:hypothetical protein
MLKSFAIKSFVALGILGAAAGALAQGDPAAVQQQLYTALARGDVGAAVALFTDDAVIDYVADKTRRVTALNTYVSGNVVLTRFEARSATIQRAGVDRIILWGIREMRGDKIATTRCCQPERTDPQTARFLAWDYAHPSVQ